MCLILERINQDEGYLEWIQKTWAPTRKMYNVYNLLSDLKSCSRKRDLQEGRRVHANAVEMRKESNIFVAASLINMYAKCGSMADARQVFDCIQEPDVVSWNTLIVGYADNGHGGAALDLFSRMKTASQCVPDSITYVAAITACATLADGDDGRKGEYLELGRKMHLEVPHHMNHFVQSSLMNLYSKCGDMIDALRVFNSIPKPDVVSWNILIRGYADNGQGHAALDLLSRMKDVNGCQPNSLTYIAAIKACASLAAEEAEKEKCLKRGREIHCEIGQHMSHFLQSTLISMYAKCGSMVDAQKVFDKIQDPDVVSWTALIVGYVDNGQSHTALDLFLRMKAVGGCVPDSVTYIAALNACSSIGALAIGQKFHSEITHITVHVTTCLVDFYAKCGSMVEAREVFDSQRRTRNITTWNVLLAGYGSFGDSGSVFNLFEAMQDLGFMPDAFTFVCMLLCCSHAGLVEKAREYIEAMPVQYGVTPTVMHYNCMIDVLGRANRLDEALDLLQKLPCNPNVVTWTTLLSACGKWKNLEIGKLAFKSLVELKEKDTASYALMAQIYGSRGMWKEQNSLLEAKRRFGASKLHGEAYAVDGSKMVKFVTGEEDHPELKDKLQQFFEDMKNHGYVAELYRISGIVAECGHNERRAVVYGILKTPPGEPIKAFKNLRMCDECHWASKMLSKLPQRVIIVRDESRFHVMENGKCSCGDYW